MTRLIALTLLLAHICLPVLAQSTPQGGESEAGDTEQLQAIEAPDPSELEGAEEEPLDLGRVEVVGATFTFEQELQLRVVRQALKNKRSEKREDIDEWVCWYEAPVGTRIKYMSCARNGDLWILREQAQAQLRGEAAPASGRGKGYGTLYRSNLPVNKKKFESNLAMLPGSDDFDKEFIAMAGFGERPPRDIPSDREFDQFAEAYLAVEQLAENGADDAALEAAITAEGLTIKRYNRIVDLIGVYQSLMNEVAQRIGRMPPS